MTICMWFAVADEWRAFVLGVVIGMIVMYFVKEWQRSKTHHD